LDHGASKEAKNPFWARILQLHHDLSDLGLIGLREKCPGGVLWELLGGDVLLGSWNP